MATGIEMMLKTLLGIDPEEIKRDMMEYVMKIRQGLETLDVRLKSIDVRLERLERHLGVDPASEEPQKRVVNQ